jgi:hypothetical protein
MVWVVEAKARVAEESNLGVRASLASRRSLGE